MADVRIAIPKLRLRMPPVVSTEGRRRPEWRHVAKRRDLAAKDRHALSAARCLDPAVIFTGLDMIERTPESLDENNRRKKSKKDLQLSCNFYSIMLK